VNVSAISAATTPPITESLSGAATPATSSGGFTRLVEQFLDQASTQQAHADQGVQALAMGQTDNLHQVLLSAAKADLTFRMVLEIRNRLTEAFQEIMRMQI
jgi:flagellar hook-basal body complex protein FliE